MRVTHTKKFKRATYTKKFKRATHTRIIKENNVHKDNQERSTSLHREKVKERERERRIESD